MSRVESDYYSYMGYDPAHSKAVLAHYLNWFPAGPVLELAPGRGEFLQLLAERGVSGYGVDSDEGMVETGVAAGLDIRLDDALAGLRAAPDGSLGGVFSAHFVEHLPPDAVQEVVRESARALRPGGHFVAATPNAACLSVLGYDFWRDPTHLRFYEAQLLAFFCNRAGLTVVETGGNPENNPGPPPGAQAGPVLVDPDIKDELTAAARRLADPKGKGKVAGDEPEFQLAHVVGVLMDRLQRTQEELADLHRAHHQLLAALYPSNEVYVVARRD